MDDFQGQLDKALAKQEELLRHGLNDENLNEQIRKLYRQINAYRC